MTRVSGSSDRSPFNTVPKWAFTIKPVPSCFVRLQQKVEESTLEPDSGLVGLDAPNARNAGNPLNNSPTHILWSITGNNPLLEHHKPTQHK